MGSPDTVSLEVVQDAIADLDRNTLSAISSEIGKLIYFASTRDYNSGVYYHDGIAFRFDERVADAALAFLHHQSFSNLVRCPVEQLADHLADYIQTSKLTQESFFELWKTLEPFRVAVPKNADKLDVALLISNIRIALAILANRKPGKPHSR